MKIIKILPKNCHKIGVYFYVMLKNKYRKSHDKIEQQYKKEYLQFIY
jgi:hypothetical protein